MPDFKFSREAKRIYKVRANDKEHALKILQDEEDRLEPEEFESRYEDGYEECLDWDYMGKLGPDGLED